VLNNLHQLLPLSQAGSERSITAAIESTIRITTEAAEAAAMRRGSSEPLIIAVRETGRVLDALTRQARTAHTLPAHKRLGAALVRHPDAAFTAARVKLGGRGTAVCSIPSQRTIRRRPSGPRTSGATSRRRARTGIPPLRCVREAALAAKLPPHTRRQRVHALVREFKWCSTTSATSSPRGERRHLRRCGSARKHHPHHPERRQGR
jgi:hypothetical protein